MNTQGDGKRGVKLGRGMRWWVLVILGKRGVVGVD